jgi:hypothetical protein
MSDIEDKVDFIQDEEVAMTLYQSVNDCAVLQLRDLGGEVEVNLLLDAEDIDTLIAALQEFKK